MQCIHTGNKYPCFQLDGFDILSFSMSPQMRLQAFIFLHTGCRQHWTELSLEFCELICSYQFTKLAQCFLINISLVFWNLYPFIEMSKTNIKVTTLVLDTPLTRQTLQEDFCAVIDTGIEEVFAREPFLRFNYSTSDDDEGCGEEEEEGLETYNDICLKVEGTRFYCNKVNSYKNTKLPWLFATVINLLCYLVINEMKFWWYLGVSLHTEFLLPSSVGGLLWWIPWNMQHCASHYA